MNFNRQIQAFDPIEHKHKRVDVIGAGATGSHVTLLLAKIGMENIHVWDSDRIEEHNIPNQLYSVDQVGEKKVIALKEVVKLNTGIEISVHDELVGLQEDIQFGDIVFLLVDTMKDRKDIWEKYIKLRVRTQLLIETRMGQETGRIYSLSPINNQHIEGWEGTLYGDEETVSSLCGTTVSIITTTWLISSIAVGQLIKWLKTGVVESELLVSSEPWTILSRNF